MTIEILRNFNFKSSSQKSRLVTGLAFDNEQKDQLLKKLARNLKTQIIVLGDSIPGHTSHSLDINVIDKITKSSMNWDQLVLVFNQKIDKEFLKNPVFRRLLYLRDQLAITSIFFLEDLEGYFQLPFNFFYRIEHIFISSNFHLDHKNNKNYLKKFWGLLLSKTLDYKEFIKLLETYNDLVINLQLHDNNQNKFNQVFLPSNQPLRLNYLPINNINFGFTSESSNDHYLVLGGKKSGKTTLIKSLLSRNVMNKVPIMVINPLNHRDRSYPHYLTVSDFDVKTIKNIINQARSMRKVIVIENVKSNKLDKLDQLLKQRNQFIVSLDKIPKGIKNKFRKIILFKGLNLDSLYNSFLYHTKIPLFDLKVFYQSLDKYQFLVIDLDSDNKLHRQPIYWSSLGGQHSTKTFQ